MDSAVGWCDGSEGGWFVGRVFVCIVCWVVVLWCMSCCSFVAMTVVRVDWSKRAAPLLSVDEPIAQSPRSLISGIAVCSNLSVLHSFCPFHSLMLYRYSFFCSSVLLVVR